MKIAAWNINGLRSGFINVKEFLKESQVDILCLQEIKVHADDISEEVKSIDGYYSFFNPAEKKGYSGTAIYSKEKPLLIRAGLGDKEIDNEGRVILADFTYFKLINFYFPHSSRDLHRLDFKINFNKVALKFIKQNLQENLIVCGDLNVAHQEIDLARPKQNKNNAGFTMKEREFFDELKALGLVDVFRQKYPDRQEFTWWGNFYNLRERNIGWRIDYFLTLNSFYNRIKKVTIARDISGSDHCPVIIEF